MTKQETEPMPTEGARGTLDTESSAAHQKTRQNARGLAFVLLVVVVTALVQFLYTLAHGLNVLTVFQQPHLQWAFEFVGGNRNPMSIGMEILTWAVTGASCKIIFLSAQAMKRGKFEFLKYLISWISTSFYAWGIGIALIFSLTIISLTIAGIEITLANASLETIIAISFIIGFYHEEALKLLGRLREQIATGMKEDGKNQGEGE